MVVVLIKRILKSDINTSHIQIMKELVASSPLKAHELLSELFGRDGSHSITQLIKTGDKSQFYRDRNAYRRTLRRFCLNKMTSIEHIRMLVKETHRMLARLIRPCGFVLVLIGPDGGGKTTLAPKVLERVSLIFHGSRQEYCRPNLLPPIGRLKVWDPPIQSQDNPCPHDHDLQNPVKSLIRFFYYLTDYIVGYAFKTYWLKVKNHIVIFDRYYHDYLVDLRRYQLNIPRWLPRLFLPIVPTPDLALYLKCDPTQLSARKQELLPEELDRQASLYSILTKELSYCHSVSTETPIEETVREVAHAILEMKVQQTRRIIKSAIRSIE